MITIESRDRGHRATLAAGDDGILVTLYRYEGRLDVRHGDPSPHYREVGRLVLETSFARACDLVYDEIWPLEHGSRLTWALPPA